MQASWGVGVGLVTTSQNSLLWVQCTCKILNLTDPRKWVGSILRNFTLPCCIFVSSVKEKKRMGACNGLKWIGKFSFIWKKINFWNTCVSNATVAIIPLTHLEKEWRKKCMCIWNFFIRESKCSNFLKSVLNESKTFWLSAVQRACNMTLLWKPSIYVILKSVFTLFWSWSAFGTVPHFINFLAKLWSPVTSFLMPTQSSTSPRSTDWFIWHPASRYLPCFCLLTSALRASRWLISLCS